ncbi:MAG: hypothetical protein HYX82_01555 [Chloroflexi bacterium]|nr:hypothetical protein [Chloroflexota bacterium]
MQQAISKGDVLQRLAGISFIVGAILTAVFNAILPRAADPSYANARESLQRMADAGVGFVQIDFLLLAVGIWALMIGVVGIYRSISTGMGAVWARLGFYGVTVGTTLFTVLFAVFGLGMPLVVESWATSSEPAKTTLFLVASSLYKLDFTLFSMSIIVYWLALLFLGIGMALSTVYPRWFGWAGIILGVVTVVAVGLPQALTGPSTLVTNTLFMVLSGLTLLWALIVGGWIARRAW